MSMTTQEDITIINLQVGAPQILQITLHKQEEWGGGIIQKKKKKDSSLEVQCHPHGSEVTPEPSGTMGHVYFLSTSFGEQ